MPVPAIRVLGTRVLARGIFSARVELKFRDHRDKIVVTVYCPLAAGCTVEQQHRQAIQQAYQIIQGIDWPRRQ